MMIVLGLGLILSCRDDLLDRATTKEVDGPSSACRIVGEVAALRAAGVKTEPLGGFSLGRFATLRITRQPLGEK